MDDYNKNGFTIIDDFLSSELANKIELMFLEENNKWEYHNQVRDKAYGEGKYGKHRADILNFPRGDEEYLAKFWRSNKLELEIDDIFNKYFLPTLRKISQTELSEYDIRCNKLESGDHYRTHIDDYAGDVGCIYYVNKKWVWDWGGILHMGIGDELKSIIPKYNRLVIQNTKKFRIPHFVSPVTKWAHQPRFSLISFNTGDKHV